MSKEEKKQEHEGVCPNCGYCPHCGRANDDAKYVPYPVPQPYPVVPPWVQPGVPWRRPFWAVKIPSDISYGNISVGTSDGTSTVN